MGRRYIFLTAVVFLMVCFNFLSVSAQEKGGDAKSRLSDLRKEMAQIKYDYQEAVQKANSSCDDKIEVARQEFHKVRTACLEDKKQKVDGLTKTYKGKTRPMEAEEKSLLETLAPAGGMNFAKTKTEKGKAKQ